MKILFIDHKTNTNFLVFHNPCEIIIKPKSKRVKIIEDADATEFDLVSHTYHEVEDLELDLVEGIKTIRVHKNSRKDYRA